MARFASSTLGGTPLVGLPSNLSPTPDVRLWAKLEDHNPTGSIKDRAAIAMIEAAEKDGRCSPAPRSWSRPAATPGSRWPWSPGSAATKLVCVMPENTSVERRQLLEMYGAQIIYSPAAGGRTRPSPSPRGSPRSTRTG